MSELQNTPGNNRTDSVPIPQIQQKSRHKSIPFDPNKKHNDQPWQYVADQFRKSAEDEALDIYQVCAWMCKQENISTTKKLFYYFKAFMCWTIQVVGLIIFLYIQIDNILDDDDIGFCAMRSGDDENINLIQVLSVFFAVYISLKMGGLITNIASLGLYKMNFWTGLNCPPFADRNFVFIGGWTNISALLLSIYGSYVVLYLSDNILDVILNSVALFFIVDVDDYMLDAADYQRILDWFDNEYDENDYADFQPDEMAIGLCIAKPMTFISYSGMCIGVFGAVFAPFWIAICH